MKRICGFFGFKKRIYVWMIYQDDSSSKFSEEDCGFLFLDCGKEFGLLWISEEEVFSVLSYTGLGSVVNPEKPPLPLCYISVCWCNSTLPVLSLK